MYRLESRMVVDQNQRVLIASMHGSHKGSRDVCVYQTSRMRWLVTLRVVRLTGCVGFDAGVTTVEASVSERSGSVGGDRRKRSKTGGARVESAMHASSGVRG
eukprot:6213245-Pleurochrysis_carterae.AAC.2